MQTKKKTVNKKQQNKAYCLTNENTFEIQINSDNDQIMFIFFTEKRFLLTYTMFIDTKKQIKRNFNKCHYLVYIW